MNYRNHRLYRVTAVILGILLCACTDSGSAEVSPPIDSGGDEVVLTMWTFGGTGQESVISEWEAANPGVTVEIVQAGFDEHHERLLAGFVSGQVPDIALVEVGYSSMFKARPKNFVDIGQSYGADELESRFLPFRWEHGLAPDGTLIGLPTDVGGLAVAYRTDLFAAAGLPTSPDEVSAMMSTWEDLLDLGEAYRDGSDGARFIDSAGLLFESVVKQGPEGFFSADGEATYETSEHVANAWSIATSAVERDLSANLSGFTPEWNTGMSQGSYALQLAPSWMLTYISTQAPETEGLWNLARFPGGGGNWGGSQLTIPAGAANPDLAYDLIEFVTAPAQQTKIFQEFGNFPSTTELYDDPAIIDFRSSFFSDAPVGLVYSESINSVEPQFEGMAQRIILREFLLALGRVENGEETPDQAWASALQNIDLEIS